MASAVAVGDPPLPEPPDPPDPLIPLSSFVQTSITKPSFLFPLFPPFPSSYPDLYLGSTDPSFVSSSDTLFACLRSLTTVCSFQNQICSQICLLPIDLLAKSVGYDVSSPLLTSAGYCLSSPASHQLLLARAAACFLFEISTSLPLPIPQVHSCSTTFVAMALWNAGLDVLFPKDLVAFGSTFLLSCGTHIAFMRSITAVCRFLSHITKSMSLMTFSTLLWQFGQRANFINRLVILVLLDFHSPFFSFTELVILPNTSLVFSGIIIGSIVLQVVLFEAEARMPRISRSAFVEADYFTLATLEALFPLLCGFAQDYQAKEVFFIRNPCLDANVLVDVLVCSASCGHFVSSLSGG